MSHFSYLDIVNMCFSTVCLPLGRQIYKIRKKQHTFVTLLPSHDTASELVIHSV